MNVQIQIKVEQYRDGFVAYAVGIKGVVVVQGDSYVEVLREIRSAIQFHIETFGKQVLENNDGS